MSSLQIECCNFRNTCANWKTPHGALHYTEKRFNDILRNDFLDVVLKVIFLVTTN